MRDLIGSLCGRSFPSAGKIERLRHLCDILGLSEAQVQNGRYLPLHRIASAIITAKRFHAACAFMRVHSFSRTAEWFEDFQQLVRLYGLGARQKHIIHSVQLDGIDLCFGWVTDTGNSGEE